MDNYSFTSSTLPFIPEEYDLEDLKEGNSYAEMGALVAAIAAAIGSVIYASKHIKSSSCCGSKCEQQVILEVAAEPRVVKKLETNV